MLIIGSSLYDERNFSNELTKDFQLIFLDHRGFVAPNVLEKVEKHYELDVILNDIALAAKKLNLQKFIICGHSGHAFLALEYAKEHQDQVIGVVLIGAAPSNSDARRQVCYEFFMNHASADRKDKFFRDWSTVEERIALTPEKRFAIMCLAAGAQSWYDYNFDASFMWDGVYTNMPIIDHLWGVAFRDIDITDGLKNFNLPVFLGLGGHDYLTGLPQLWNDLLEKFQNIDVHVFEKSGHNPHYEEPTSFNKTLLDWKHKIYSR